VTILNVIRLVAVPIDLLLERPCKRNCLGTRFGEWTKCLNDSVHGPSRWLKVMSLDKEVQQPSQILPHDNMVFVWDFPGRLNSSHRFGKRCSGATFLRQSLDLVDIIDPIPQPVAGDLDLTLR
jgi:hypothetical protein